jgi:cephalosporin hydroxylase
MLSALGRALRHEIKTLRGSFYRRLAQSHRQETTVVDAFHRLYFDARAYNMTWRNTFYMGHAILKCPLDLWHYQEILHETRPDLIIETGTAFGGSALYLAHLCDLLGAGRVVTVDIESRAGRPQHPRITYVTGSSVSSEVVSSLQGAAREAQRVMVILDSDHSKGHVLAELRALAPLVTPGSYLIVEDTNLNGHPVEPDYGPGPMEAMDAFLAETPAFAIDQRWEKFFLSFNPRGYLKRQ